MTTPPPLPGRVWNPDTISDGSHTLADLATGEIIRRPASEVRARRLAARQERHEQSEAERREQARQAAARGAESCREALPKRTPIGLVRDG